MTARCGVAAAGVRVARRVWVHAPWWSTSGERLPRARSTARGMLTETAPPLVSMISAPQPLRLVISALTVLLAACSGTPPAPPPAPRPSILLVTLDTTRADAIGPGAAGVTTPGFDAVAARGRRFLQAYATVPETLPSHASMMTGLYPAGHGIHENARTLAAAHDVLADRLRQAGYRTTAFVSSFVLARRFGLARGFDVYDDELPAGEVERRAAATTDRAIAELARSSSQPRFVWVHYFEPHTPYQPPEPFRSQYAAKPYLGEIALMDRELGRLVDAFEKSAERSRTPAATIIAGDHGEGLGDRGESQHGHLLYQSTMHVPLVMAGPGVAAGTSAAPVSIRRVFHTVLDFAGLGSDHTLRAPDAALSDVVLGEAMKPFLEYGWQPQVMAVAGSQKAILSRTTEVYDLAADPGERRNLGSGANLSPMLRKALDDYPVPSPEAARAPDALSDDARRSLASLGYVSGTAAPVVRKDAPRPVDMVHLFDRIERASILFVAEKYADAIPLLKGIQAEDPFNLDATLRLATSYSALGRKDEAVAAFRHAAAIAPRSPDVRTYLALHYTRAREWERAAPLLEQVVAESPDRLPAIEALALVREQQGRPADAIALTQKVHALKTPTAPELIRLGELAMATQQTPLAIESFEKARGLQGAGFAHDLELGVLYLAARDLTRARDALDRVSAGHPGYPMALFKRAQVSVLLKEPDSAARIARARQSADATTRALIASERLFR
jgi:choline-sulfatase